MSELVEPWILRVTFSLDPGEVKSERLESEYLDLGPVRIFPRFKLRSTKSRGLAAGTGGKYNLKHNLKMSRVSVAHAPLEISRIPVEKTLHRYQAWGNGGTPGFRLNGVDL